MTIRTYARLCNALSRGPFGPAGLRGRVGGGRLGAAGWSGVGAPGAAPPCEGV
ncbi:hypothetical protein SSAG_06094 [Streptomyces sp. Mg1]|nr:hypothetical protein SSAG_06094 [Streptomyces sp. Mg1]